MTEMQEAALGYAARGWYVIPVHGVREDGACTCSRPACPTPGKHPIMAGAFDKYASIDPTIVAQWWTTWPNANVGVVCGEKSKLWVLDIDGAHGMMEVEKYEESRPGGPLPDTARCRTGSGGMHMYWAWREETRLRTKIAAHFGIDVKANGFVVAPPSRHASGATYLWEMEGSLVPAPDDLIRWVKGDENAKPEEEWPSIEEMRKNGLPEGKRDDGMFHAALKLKRAGMSRHDAEAIIEQIALKCMPVFPLDQARAKIDAAWKFDEEEKARHAPEQQAWAEGLGKSKSKSGDDLLWPGFGGTTDRDNAERLSALWKDAKAVIGGGWLVFDGEVWKRVERPSLQASHMLYEILSREMQLVDLEHSAALAKWRHNCGSVSRVNAALSLLETEPSLSVGELDPDPYLLGVKNGVLDLRTGELREYRREDMITRRAGAEWLGGDVDCVTFKQTLGFGLKGEDDVTAGEIAQALQAFFGVCMTGVSVKNFLVLHGPGNTGKSSLIEAFAWALGDYATSAPRGLLTMRRGSNETHPTILTELEGRRFVYASEPGAGEELNVELIKDVTGGAELKARKMRQDFYTFRTECKPVIDTNHSLRLKDVSLALEERMISLGLLSAIPDEARKNRDAVNRALEGEASGILAWAWRGLQRVMELCGGILPGDLTRVLGETVLAERRDEIADQDVVGRFFREELEETSVSGDDAAFLTMEQVMSRYVWWSVQQDLTMNSEVFRREFKKALKEGRYHLTRRYVKTTKARIGGSQRTGYWGLRLIESSDAEL